MNTSPKAVRFDDDTLWVTNPVRREVQPDDGRIRHWVWIEELNRFLRVVTLEDGTTVHNAFPDRRFSP